MDETFEEAVDCVVEGHDWRRVRTFGPTDIDLCHGCGAEREHVHDCFIDGHDWRRVPAFGESSTARMCMICDAERD